MEGISNHRCLRARVLPFTVRAPLRGRLCTGSDSLDDGAAHNALARTLHGYRRAADERHLAGIGPVRVRGGIARSVLIAPPGLMLRRKHGRKMTKPKGQSGRVGENCEA